MNIKPLADNVVIKATEAEETTKSGIVLTSSAKEKPQVAVVVAVGPGGTVDGKEVVMTVKAGDKVTYGQQIAKCGSTGQSSGNHVHYEIRVNGKVKNPLDGEAPCVTKPGT